MPDFRSTILFALFTNEFNWTLSYLYLLLTNRPFRAQEALAAIDVCKRSGITIACSVYVVPANKLSTGCIRCSPSFWSARIYCSSFWWNILSVVECWTNWKAVVLHWCVEYQPLNLFIRFVGDTPPTPTMQSIHEEHVSLLNAVRVAYDEKRHEL